MELTANRQVNLTPTTQLQSQTSGNSDQSSGKPFDPELLKDEKIAQGVARELADAQSTATSAATKSTAQPAAALAAAAATETRSLAEWTRDEGAPNWSSLSAHSKGYTFAVASLKLYHYRRP